jgi:large subunit ribosomal protein L21
MTTEDRTMYAVIKTGGKQEKVQTGDVIQVELLDEDEDASTVTFQPLLVVDDAGTTHVGKGLSKAVVKAKVAGEKKGAKVKVVKYRPKTRYRRNNGHRQRYTVLEIQAIELGAGAAKPKAAAKPAAKPK